MSQDSKENEFYDARGSASTHYIPADLGNILFYWNGPSAVATDLLGQFVLTFYITFRGVRIDSDLALVRSLTAPRGRSPRGSERSRADDSEDVEMVETLPPAKSRLSRR
jgi:hypothetical protein